VTGSVLDLVLLVIGLAFAATGYRQGLVVGFLGFVGFLGGALLGLQVSPLAAEWVDPGVGRVLVALLVVFAIASVGQALAVVIGSALRSRLPGKTTRTVDSLGGAVVSVVAALLVVWMVAAPLASAPVPWLASQVRRSVVIASVDNAMPESVRRLYARLGSAVSSPRTRGSRARRSCAAPSPPSSRCSARRPAVTGAWRAPASCSPPNAS
jgi:uncharacterized membrane protein required for colicin V production